MKILIFLAFLCLHVNAVEIITDYKITFGLFGEIGVAHAKFVKNDTNYTISIEANSTGFAKFVSRNRAEYFKSEGEVLENGLLSPKTYTHIVSRNKKKNDFNLNPNKWKDALSEKIDIINFEKNAIFKTRIKKFDGKLILKEKTKLDFNASDDLLSLFFNFKQKTNNFNIKNEQIFNAVGAGKNGKLSVIKMDTKSQIDTFSDKFGYDFIVIINQKIFSSKKGELFVRLDENGICTKAVLKDVLFFGDIKGSIVENIK